MDGAAAVVDLLRRNSLNTYAVWRFPSTVLSMTAVAIAIGFTACATIIFMAWGATVVKRFGGSPDASAALSSMAAAVAGGVFALTLAVISFLSSVVISIVDAIYLSWASELDCHTVLRPEVHAVYNAIPSVRAPGNLVQQPDGELGFAPAPVQVAQRTT